MLDPLLRQGLGNPLPLTAGLVLLEVRGRRSGNVRAVPLLCVDYGVALVVSTVRRNSQWVANLAATPAAAVWLRGRRQPVTAAVFRDGERLSPDDAPGTFLLEGARAWSQVTGSSVAVLRLAQRNPSPVAGLAGSIRSG